MVYCNKHTPYMRLLQPFLEKKKVRPIPRAPPFPQALIPHPDNKNIACP